MKIAKKYFRLPRFSPPQIIKNTSIVFLGNIFNAGFVFLFITLVSRVLGPGDFGLFSVALAILTVMEGIAQFGTTPSLTRLASFYLKQGQPGPVKEIMGAILRFRLVMGILIALVGWWLAIPLAFFVFKEPKLVPLLRISSIGVSGLLLSTYIYAVLQAYEQFLVYAGVNVFIGAGRFLLGLGLLYFYRLSPTNSCLVYIIPLFLAFLAGGLFIPKGYLMAKTSKKIHQQIFFFSKWLVAASFLGIIYNRLDMFIIARLLNMESVGIYSSAFRLASLLLMISGTITIVLFPKVSSFTKVSQVRSYLKKAAVVSLGISALLSPFWFVSLPLVKAIYGPAYISAAGIFRILLPAFMIEILYSPLVLVLYAINKPQHLTFLAAGNILICFWGNLFLIPLLQVEGAAIITLLVRLFNLTYLTVYLYFVIFRSSEKELHPEGTYLEPFISEEEVLV